MLGMNTAMAKNVEQDEIPLFSSTWTRFSSDLSVQAMICHIISYLPILYMKCCERNW